MSSLTRRLENSIYWCHKNQLVMNQEVSMSFQSWRPGWKLDGLWFPAIFLRDQTLTLWCLQTSSTVMTLAYCRYTLLFSFDIIIWKVYTHTKCVFTKFILVHFPITFSSSSWYSSLSTSSVLLSYCFLNPPSPLNTTNIYACRDVYVSLGGPSGDISLKKNY